MNSILERLQHDDKRSLRPAAAPPVLPLGPAPKKSGVRRDVCTLDGGAEVVLTCGGQQAFLMAPETGKPLRKANEHFGKV